MPMRWQRLGGDTELARYRLTAPHFVTNRLGVPALKEAGSIIDSLDLPPHWQPTPAMEPLDDEAEAEHAKVMHEATAGGTQVEITGFGHLRDLPRGNEHLPKAYPTARLKSRYYWVSAVAARSMTPALTSRSTRLLNITRSWIGPRR